MSVPMTSIWEYSPAGAIFLGGVGSGGHGTCPAVLQPAGKAEPLIFRASVGSGFLALMPASVALHSCPSARTCEISWVEW